MVSKAPSASMPPRPPRNARVVLVAAFTAATASASSFHGHRSSAMHRPPAHHELIASPRPDAVLADGDVPRAFDWRNVNGISYVTADVNQHIPTYCGSCWIHGTVAALNDRIKIARQAAFPDAMLSRQALMNCVPDHNASLPPPGCNGGDAWMIQHHLAHHSVGDETCPPYAARNGKCDALGRCRNCLPPDMEGSPVATSCWAVPSYVRYGVAEYGHVAGEQRMQKEILARGPIVCSVAADERFMFSYADVTAANEGVYVDRSPKTTDDIDHDVEVAGWGVTASGLKYWVVRNSWGSYWGNHGWFKLLRGENSLMIESDCDWAVPTADNLDAVLAEDEVGDYVHGVTPAAKAKVMTAKAVPAKAVPAKPAAAAAEVTWAGLQLYRSMREEPLLPPALTTSAWTSPAAEPTTDPAASATTVAPTANPSALVRTSSPLSPLGGSLIVAMAVCVGLGAGFTLAAWRARPHSTVPQDALPQDALLSVERPMAEQLQGQPYLEWCDASPPPPGMRLG